MKKLELTQNKVALVDDEDFEYLNQWKWSAHYGRGKWYAIRNQRINGEVNIIYLHRFIMKTPENLVVDHKDDDGLNCQRYNMRNCTQSQNMQNSSAKNKNNLKGVGRITGGTKYTAQIHLNGIKKHLGSFNTAVKAAKAYNTAATKYFGEFACLNEIKEVI